MHIISIKESKYEKLYSPTFCFRRNAWNQLGLKRTRNDAVVVIY